LISCSSIKVRNLANSGHKKAIRLQSLLSAKYKVIIMILVFTNIANTTFTIVGETLLGEIMHKFESLTGNATLGVLLTTIILTPPLVIFGEIFPKTLFRRYSFSLTLTTAPFLYRLKFFCAPFLIPLSIFNRKESQRRLNLQNFSKDALHLLLESSTETGKIMDLQEKTIKHVMNLSSVLLGDMQIPLYNTPLLNANMRGKQAIQFIKEQGISAPYFIQRKSKIVGHINLKNLWAMPENEKVENHLQSLPVLSVNETGLKGLNQLLLTKAEYTLIQREKKIAGFISLKEIISPQF